MLNRIVIMGRMTRDPELRKTNGGTSVASFTLAVDRDLTPKGGEKETDFIDCVAWAGTADFVSGYFFKGSMAVVDGRIRTATSAGLLRSWQTVFTSAKERNLRSRRTRKTPAGLR